MVSLRRNYTVDDLVPEMQAAGIDGAIVVQARQSLDETRDLLHIANGTQQIAGVVGWLPLQDRYATESAIEALNSAQKLVGVRHIVQGEPPGFLDQASFNDGICSLRGSGLVYEILIHEHQLIEATRLVDRHPNQAFVLDHIAKPKIAAGEMEPWASCLRDLARRPNVSCKLSGLVTEASWKNWSPEILRPYLDVASEAFGPERLLAGSDWPVSLLASRYGRWWTVLRNFFADWSGSERTNIFGGNASRIYRLPDNTVDS